MALFALMTLAVRMADGQVHPLEVAFFRASFGLAAVLPLVAWQGPLRFRTRRHGRHLVRSVAGIGSMWCGFWALGRLPMAQVVAISYLAPLMATGIAAFGLREREGVRHWIALLAGFAGVLLVARPHQAAADYAGVAAAVGASVFTALSHVSIRHLASTESAEQIVFWSSVAWVGLTLVPALAVWTAPAPTIWPWLALAGLAGTLGHLLWARALRLGRLSRIAPLSFLQLPLASMLGYLCLRERIDTASVAGGAIIVGSNVWVMRAGPAARARRLAPGAPPMADVTCQAALRPGEPDRSRTRRRCLRWRFTAQRQGGRCPRGGS
jgi:drug/metabolite transporter (DMT)-like permease